jgi:hypothetical protein
VSDDRTNRICSWSRCVGSVLCGRIVVGGRRIVTPGTVRFGPKFEFKPQTHVYYSVDIRSVRFPVPEP